MEVVCCFCEIILLFQDRDMFIAGNSKWLILLILLGAIVVAWEKKKSCINKTKEVK